MTGEVEYVMTNDLVRGGVVCRCGGEDCAQEIAGESKGEMRGRVRVSVRSKGRGRQADDRDS